MRIAVTGVTGQVAQSLAERGPSHGVTIIPVGRPALDLANARSVYPALADTAPDAIVNAAAYTAVDQAEREAELAFAVNAAGAGEVAQAAARLGAPLLHLSTDYVFGGELDRPYREDDAAMPACVYGESKLQGERAVLSSGGTAAVFRTAWVYSPFGRNFAKTMTALAASRDEIRVVDDQVGSPTSAFDIADALILAAKRLVREPDNASLCGLFHLAGRDSASWCEFAAGIFGQIEARTGRRVRAAPIPSSDYPTPVKRPANSRLDGAKLRAAYGIDVPGWRVSLPGVVARLTA